MRGRRISILFVGVLLVLGGITWVIWQRPRPQTLSLPDGSLLTLIKITYGTNHVCRYGNRWQDLLHPILPQKLRVKFPPRQMTYTSGGGDTVMVWLRHEGGTATTGRWPPPFFLAVADENGLESRLLQNANVTRSLNVANPAAATPTGAGPVRVQLAGSATQMSGWELKFFPRRVEQFGLRVYRHEASDKVVRVGEFHVSFPRSGNFPIWAAEPLPSTRRTNGLEISLTKLETGLTGKETGHGPAGEGAKSFSRATFTLKEKDSPTEEWSVCGISASSAADEVRPRGSYGSLWQGGEHKVNFDGGLWLEETWKVDVDFARTGNFPPDELWSVHEVGVPKAGELMEARVVTNLHHAELEFLGVSGPRTKLPEDYAGIRPNANIHVRTPHPMEGLRLVMVEVRDDQGRKLANKGSSARSSTGGRGNTPKEMLHGFAVEIPEDSKSLDITFAVTRVRSVEFLAKPSLTESARTD
jgi:hypothetical protein